jgi:hypothetical protein
MIICSVEILEKLCWLGCTTKYCVCENPLEDSEPNHGGTKIEYWISVRFVNLLAIWISAHWLQWNVRALCLVKTSLDDLTPHASVMNLGANSCSLSWQDSTVIDFHDSLGNRSQTVESGGSALTLTQAANSEEIIQRFVVNANSARLGRDLLLCVLDEYLGTIPAIEQSSNVSCVHWSLAFV